MALAKFMGYRLNTTTAGHIRPKYETSPLPFPQKRIIIQPIWWDLPLVEFLCTVCHVSSPLIYIYGCCQRHLVPPHGVVYVHLCLLLHTVYICTVWVYYTFSFATLFSLFFIDFLVSHCVLISLLTRASFGPTKGV